MQTEWTRLVNEDKALAGSRGGERRGCSTFVCYKPPSVAVYGGIRRCTPATLCIIVWYTAVLTSAVCV